jgi:hypothetical protein
VAESAAKISQSLRLPFGEQVAISFSRTTALALPEWRSSASLRRRYERRRCTVPTRVGPQIGRFARRFVRWPGDACQFQSFRLAPVRLPRLEVEMARITANVIGMTKELQLLWLRSIIQLPPTTSTTRTKQIERLLDRLALSGVRCGLTRRRLGVAARHSR